VYRCAYHSEMQGTIVVEAPAAPANAPAPPDETAAPGSAHSTASDDGGGPQPDTALPTNDDRGALIGQLLIGLGLVALAFGLVPSGLRSRRPATEVAHRRASGWRR
jgi:hypothetical protein